MKASAAGVGRGVCLALVGALVLAGCGQDPQFGEPVTDPGFALGQSQAPAVVWPQGKPVDEVDEADASWVATLREWDLLVNASAVTHDFSDARMQELSPWQAEQGYIGPIMGNLIQAVYYDDGSRVSYPPGPTPMIVESVEHVGDDVRIRICGANQWRQWKISPSLDGVWRDYGKVITFVLTEEEGSRVVADRIVSDDRCSLKSARVGYFDPVPDYGEVPAGDFIGLAGDVVDPDDYVWVSSGVSDQWNW